MNLISIEPERQPGTDIAPIRFQNGLELEDWLILLPPTLIGFSLSTQQQLDLHVFQIETVEWTKDPLDGWDVQWPKDPLDGLDVQWPKDPSNGLAIEWTKDPLYGLDVEQDMKHLLLSVLPDSASVTRDRARGDDTNGTTVLLQGGPGTGKRYIIDILAEAAKLPLHRVNLAEIATTPTEFSKSLETIRASQVAWNCIVHLVDADIFVEHVQKMDAKFLLINKFFDFLQTSTGLLFMSVNRHPWDDSRFSPVIDLKVSSEAISRSHRANVWRAELAAACIPIGHTRADNIGPDVVNPGDPFFNHELLEFHLNDRQIHKAVEHTLALASQRQKPADARLLRQVLRLRSRETNDYAYKP